MSPDGIITQVTEAATDADALAILAGVPHRTLLAVADLLYVGPCGRTSTVRNAIVKEARA